MLKKRKSGILLHITSLPSSYGIGDLGPEAFQFVDFLEQGAQRLWQVLPFNPTQHEFQHSPYSSTSAFAGNALLLSPELLRQEGLISTKELTKIFADFPRKNSTAKVDYQLVKEYKNKIFEIIFANRDLTINQIPDFDRFCKEQTFWLEDFALFELLNKVYPHATWNKWPRGLKDRKHTDLERIKEEYEKKLTDIKFLQYLFFKQWQALKDYCHTKKIQIIGDLPLYVNYQSADVWSHPELFKLAKDKKPLAVAGVPPDYFSADGQLWNNPLYNWAVMKKQGFDWWYRRLEQNFKLYDWVRLDHFRGFAAYWEVPAGEKTARNGKWVPGPGHDLFNALLNFFPTLPVIAEDLGDIDAAVRELRDEFMLPGMRVLQFAFGEDNSSAIYRPHNYISNCIAYTGTHDNNTLLGWLFEDYKGMPPKTGKMPKFEQPTKAQALNYVQANDNPIKEVPWDFIRSLMASVAAFVIFPMQDLLGLDASARMNLPGTTAGNWEWRLVSSQLTAKISDKLKAITRNYGRL